MFHSRNGQPPLAPTRSVARPATSGTPNTKPSYLWGCPRPRTPGTTTPNPREGVLGRNRKDSFQGPSTAVASSKHVPVVVARRSLTGPRLPRPQSSKKNELALFQDECKKEALLQETRLPRPQSSKKNELALFQDECKKEVLLQETRQQRLRLQADRCESDVVAIKTTLSDAHARRSSLEQELRQLESDIVRESEILAQVVADLNDVVAEEAALEEEKTALSAPEVVPVVKDSELLRAVPVAKSFLRELERRCVVDRVKDDDSPREHLQRSSASTVEEQKRHPRTFGMLLQEQP